MDFPIVKAFVDKGAECGIGVFKVYPGEKDMENLPGGRGALKIRKRNIK
jgi:pyruvate/oxaloacetate carboxyltransferase